MVKLSIDELIGTEKPYMAVTVAFRSGDLQLWGGDKYAATPLHASIKLSSQPSREFEFASNQWALRGDDNSPDPEDVEVLVQSVNYLRTVYNVSGMEINTRRIYTIEYNSI